MNFEKLDSCDATVAVPLTHQQHNNIIFLSEQFLLLSLSGVFSFKQTLGQVNRSPDDHFSIM